MRGVGEEGSEEGTEERGENQGEEGGRLGMGGGGVRPGWRDGGSACSQQGGACMVGQADQERGEAEQSQGQGQHKREPRGGH